MTDPARDRVCIAGTAFAAFLVYLITAYPSVPPGDSGELIAAAWTGGVPHPPGYPLYTMVGWLWSHLLWPFGNVAWRLNIFSAAAMAGAVGFLVAGARQAGAGRWSAVTAAATFALASESWRAATAAEVFAGHACLTAAILWLLLRWANGPAAATSDASADTSPDATPDAPPRVPWVAALLLGLAGAHHQTSLFLVPAIGFWCYVHRHRFGEPLLKRAGLCVGIAGAAALLPYLVLMPLSARDDALVWGDLTTIGDPTGYWSGSELPESARIVPAGQQLLPSVTKADYSAMGDGLHHHVRRIAYGPLLGSHAGKSVAKAAPGERLRHVAAWLFQYVRTGCGGLWLLGLILAAFGSWRAWAGRESTAAAAKVAGPGLLGALLAASFGGSAGFFLAAAGLALWFATWSRLHETPQARVAWFLVLAWFVAGPLFIAFGINFDASDTLRQAVVARFFVMPAVPLALLGALGLHALRTPWGVAVARGVGVACVVVAFGAARWSGASPGDGRTVELFGRHLLASIPDQSGEAGGTPALLFVQGDVSNNAIDYLQYCEGARPDIAMLNQQKLTYPWNVRREVRRFGADPATAVAIPGQRYDGRLVTNHGLIAANIARRRVYFFGMQPGDTTYQRSYVRVPHGLLTVMVPRDTPIDFAAIEATNLAILEAFDWPAVLAIPDDAYFLNEVRTAHATAWNDLALFFHTGPNGGKNPVDYARAATTYSRGLELYPNHPPLLLGYGLLLAQELQRPADGRPYLTRYLQLRPDDARAAAIAQLAGLQAVPAPK